LTPVQGNVREANGYAVVTTRDLPAGTLLTEMMAEVPRRSLLWRLRREQDEGFPGE
jgi:predicted homoserine dehydrogenase-like protein